MNNNTMNNEKLPASLRAEENIAVPGRKREIIKTILIIFLVIMLLLTFFSNTIMNKSLAEITTESVTSGKLTERVRGSGMIESNQSYDVTVDGNKVVDTVLVKAGQNVEKDTVLFTVGTGESPELTEAEQMLTALELDYQRALLAAPVDYSSENKAISNARDDLNAAIAKRDSAYANSSSQQMALAQYNNNKTALSQKQALQGKLSATISAIDADDYSMAALEYIDNLVQLYNDYISADEDYNAAYSLYTQLLSSGADITEAKAEADRLKISADEKKAVYDAKKNSVRAGLVSQHGAVLADIDYLNAQISTYESEMQNSSFVSVEELENDVITKQRILEDLVINLAKTQKEDNVNSQLMNLDVEAKKAEVDKQTKKVEKLRKECETTEIRSKYSGVVTSVNIQPGETTIPDAPVISIDISEEGYTVKVYVDAEKASQVKKGVQAEVVNNWSGDVKAVLTDIRNDTESNSDSRILVFNVTGDVDSGTNLDLSIPCGSGNYDVIVPKSAVYEDSNGKFVLTVQAKSSPLGNRYYAERVNVEVLASDETSSAVNGSLTAGTYVITAASLPVSPGDQVRMKD